MPFATSHDGALIHWQTMGSSGPWVVLIQGLGLSSLHWADQPHVVATGGHRVMVVDNRGAGRSARPLRPYRIGQMAGDVVAAMDAAGVEQAAIVGISMGGMVAQEVALLHPGRVTRLVLVATTPGLPHGAIPGPRALSLLARMPLLHARGEAAAVYRHLFFSARPDHEAKPLVERLMGHWGALPATERAGPADYLLQLQACMAHSTGFRLKQLRVPTHIVTGDADVVIPPRNAQILARLVPRASLEILPRVGHAVPVEDPEVVLRALAR